MNDLIHTLGSVNPQVWARVISSVVLVIALSTLRWAGLRVIRRQLHEPESRYRWGKGLTYVVAVLSLFLLVWIWFSGIGQLGTFLGLFTAALAIALRELVTDFAGWIFILWRHPFRVGDRVEITGLRGDVVDLRLFQFSLLELGRWVDGDQPTGRVIHIPNGKVFSEPVANYDAVFPLIWHEIPVMLTFESDWKAAKQLFTEIANRYGIGAEEASRFRAEWPRYAVTRLAGDPTVITSVADSGVVLTLRFLLNPRERRTINEKAWEDVLEIVASRGDVVLAYPTSRVLAEVDESLSKPPAPSE